MAFKLGRAKAVTAIGGIIKSRLYFKKEPSSIPGNAVLRKPLPDGIIAEANSPAHSRDANTIYLNENIDPNSPEYKQVINHEMRHATDMKLGKLAYDDNSITYNGEVFLRETRNGKDMILVDGSWKEAGDEGFPWEDDANNGNDNGTV